MNKKYKQPNSNQTPPKVNTTKVLNKTIERVYKS